MDIFTAAELSSLVADQPSPCVSVYLPTHVAGPHAEEDTVRLKNLLNSAEEQLTGTYMRAAEARDLLESARRLPTDAAYWRERSRGLVLFLSPVAFRPYRLPLAFEELAIVDRRFHIKPLLPLLAGGERFFMLALSQNNVRLFSMSRHAVETVEVPDLPANMKQALNYVGADRGSQVHSAMSQSLGKQAAVFHGQGGEPDTRKDELAGFFRMIDAALAPVMRDETAPLLLAGVDYLLPILREVSGYKHIAEQEMVGNCDYLTPHQLHQKAWPLMEPTFQRDREAATAKYRQLAGTGKASGDIRQIVPAANEGRIESLIVDVQAHQWGRYEPQAAHVELHAKRENGDADLLDLAVAKTLENRGRVYAAEHGLVPSGESAAATFRY